MNDPLDTPLVSMRGISKSYGGVRVLANAHLTVHAGEVLGLVGENGAGKSTLVKILSGEVARDGGELFWQGKTVALGSRRNAERLGIAMIHQELNLAPHLTVAENIMLGHEPARAGVIRRARNFAEAREGISRLGFALDPRIQVNRLSPAARQLVEIARAVARAERLVIMDEPTSSLTSHEAEELFRVIRRLKSEGTAVIFVTHRLEELAQIADRVTVLRDGATVHEGPMPSEDFSELIRAMVGRELKDFYPARRHSPGKVALEVRGLTRPPSFRNAGFTVRQGEIVGVAGLVGAGRTELLEAIFGARPAESGEIFIDGERADMRAPQDAISRGVALITEDRKRTGLGLQLSVAHNSTLAHLRALVRRGVIDLGKEQAVAGAFRDRLAIRARSVRQAVGQLSGGNQQKVVLAKWLFREAHIFLFDEPTRGVDVGAKAEIYLLMNHLVERGDAILMVSSELPEILGMTDRVLVMRDGEIVKELATGATSQEEIMGLATLAGTNGEL